MTKVPEKDSGRMYSWWWNSHISPKNSKWLQENLTDMDTNVKVMIKLIEEDADSFARRAEMYYKKRPELMKMVEEFYRAYRALAERYDHATGVIRQAHHTMAEHFPNQVPAFGDDSPFSGTDPRTPDGDYTDEYDSARRRRTSKISGDSFGVVERAKRGLNFDEAEEKEQSTEGNGKSPKSNLGSESQEIRDLKEAIAKLEEEKEAGLAHYQQSLDKLSQLESEISKTQEDFSILTDHASKAENEVLVLKEALSKSETEKEAKLHDYQQSLDRISELQNIVSTLQEEANKLDKRSSSAETEAESLKAELKKLILEKDEALNQYVGSLGKVSNMESKLQLAEEGSRMLQERAENAETEVENLKQTVFKLTEEKEALAMQYQNCLETLSILEKKLKSAEEEAKRLHVEIDNGATKLKGAEEQCHMLEKSNKSLHSELESLMLKMGTQNQELTEKQKELGRLWACVQEERLRFVEAETAFQTLQHLHAKTQEELRSMASELQKRAQLLKVLETNNQNLQDEVVKVKGENKHLDELNASSALSINDMQNEISCLRDSKGKLEEEVELRVDQRNALQQEIYCLKEELNNLKETCQKESSEKAALLEKLVILEQLLEKNFILETSLADLNDELEAVRGKMETLEQSFQALLVEKSTLVTEKTTLVLQLEETSKNVERLSENNTVLQNSLSDAQIQLETLTAKSKLLEDSCQLLVNEKASLISEKDGLNSELANTKNKLQGLEKIYGELEGRCFTLEKEKESTLRKVEQLQISLDGERQEHGNYIHMREVEVNLLHEECQCRKRELDQVIDNVVHNEIEMFVLHRTSQELSENHMSVLVNNQKLLHESILSREKICQLEKSNLEQEVEIKSLCDQATSLRVGTSQLLKELDIFEKHISKDETDQDKVNFAQLLNKLQSMKESLFNAEEENHQRTVELSVLIAWVRQLTLDSKNLEVEKCAIENELKAKTEQILALQSEVLAVLDLNEELKSKLKEEDCNKEALANQIEDLNKKLKNMQSACQVLETEKLGITEQKRSLMEKLTRSDEKNNVLEEENDTLCGEVIALDNMSLIFRSFDIENELKARTEQILALQSEVLAVLDLNEELKSKLKEEGCNKEALVNQIEDLNKKLKDMQSACQVLETEKLGITEQKRSLMDRLTRSDEKNNVLEEENDILCGEVIALDNMSLIFRSFSNERCMELRELGNSFNKLQDSNAAFIQKLSLTEAKLQESKTENHNLEGRLQKSKDELIDIVAVKSQLTDEIENRKQVLHKMELELQEAERKIILVETEKMELAKNLEDLRENHDQLVKENNCLLGVSQVQESELHELHGENNKRKIQEQNLQRELETRTDETSKLEEEAASLYGQLYYSMVGHLLYEQKFNELHEAFISCSDETEELKTQLAAYGPEMIALEECVSYLENHTNIHTKFQNPENEEIQGSEAMNLHENVPNADKKMPKPPTCSDLIDLRTRLQAVEMGAIEIKEMMVQENMDLHSKLDASTKQLELLQSESGRHRRNWKPSSEITEEESTTLTKDIMLDQVSDGSSYGFSKREPIETDNDKIVEYWETADRDGSIGLTVGKSKRLVSPSIDTPDFRRVKSVKKLKEISVDKLDVSKRFTEPLPEGNKRKVLERLDSDVQKLVNLQITVQDLKKKLVVTEKDKRGKAVIQCESLKGQLDEADVAILKLFDLNGRLVRTVEDGSSFSEAKSSFDLEGEEGAKRRRVSEQARRMSEKIGRLQLEVQKLQFILLKIDGENDGKAKMAEIKRRVLLRDFLYGGGKKGQRRKKTQFCACAQPSTIED